MKRIGFLQAACTLTVALLLAACSQDDFSGGLDERLPEGKYPLQISSVSISGESFSEPWIDNAPETRVAEGTDGNYSQWSDGDLIGVQIPGSKKTGKYKVKVDQSGTVTGLEAETELYWENRESVKVKCWYPADTTKEIRLDDQKNNLVYLFYGETNKAVNYKTKEDQVHFELKHLMAKVRFRIIGEGADEVKQVKVRGYLSFMFKPNSAKKIIYLNNSAYDLPMKKVIYNNITYWEANLLPGQPILKFKLDNKLVTIVNYPASVAGKVHTITIHLK